jgi:hypothetical protein
MAKKAIDPRKFLERFKQDNLSEVEEEQLFQSFFAEKAQNEKNRILALHQAHQRTRLFRIKVLAYSSAAILLGLIGFWWLRQSSEKPVQKPIEIVAELVQKHAQTFVKRENILMSPPQQENLAWESAYDAKNFGKTIEILEKNKLSDTTKFYLGLCYLQNMPSQPQKAIKTWATIANPKYLQDEMKWWMALAYLRIDDKVLSLIHI